jgi:hypothetical protein
VGGLKFALSLNCVPRIYGRLLQLSHDTIVPRPSSVYDLFAEYGHAFPVHSPHGRYVSETSVRQPDRGANDSNVR